MIRRIGYYACVLQLCNKQYKILSYFISYYLLDKGFFYGDQSIMKGYKMVS